ncbi:MAG: hypothetical protein MJ106_00920 [Lentisphaeria bacterium]|nr:hypothetical protein [Lentisphaeria bacterium]
MIETDGYGDAYRAVQQKDSEILFRKAPAFYTEGWIENRDKDESCPEESLETKRKTIQRRFAGGGQRPRQPFAVQFYGAEYSYAQYAEKHSNECSVGIVFLVERHNMKNGRVIILLKNPN